MGSIEAHRSREHRSWWWVYVTDPTDGRLVVMGPMTTQQEAANDGFEKVGHLPFETVALRTRDRRVAREMVQVMRRGQGAQLEGILRQRQRKGAARNA